MVGAARTPLSLDSIRWHVPIRKDDGSGSSSSITSRGSRGVRSRCFAFFRRSLDIAAKGLVKIRDQKGKDVKYQVIAREGYTAKHTVD